MKSFFTISFLLCIALSGFGQPAINAPDVPTFGTKVNIHLSDGAMSIGDGGQNTIWDLSPMTFTYPPVTSTVIDPTATDQASSFPDATLAIKTVTDNYQFYNVNPQQLVRLGEANPEYEEVFTDPLNIAGFPLNYNDPQSDTYEGSFTTPTATVTVTGSSTTEYDGYGTLITIKGTFENVVRIKMVYSRTEHWDLGTSSYTTGYAYEDYYWMYPGDFIPVMSSSNINIYFNGNITGQQQKIKYYEKVLTSNHSFKISEKNITANPNPFDDVTIIDFNDFESGYYVLTLSNSTGQIVHRDSLNIRKGNLHKMELDHLPKDIYLLQIQSPKYMGRSKLVKN